MSDYIFQDMRREYDHETLRQEDLRKNPYLQLKDWLQIAIDKDCPDATAMVLATADQDNHPDARIVLLKKLDETTIGFFTYFSSEKGQQIENNPFVALNFYWSKLERQVRIKGKISKLPNAQADDYFASRPKTSQVAAAVSEQSEVLESREALENAFETMLKEYENKDVPRPQHWGGYVVTADYFEFWQGGENRLHDRFVYKKEADWSIHRLAP